MTNGEVIKTMFPDVEVKEKNNGYEVYFGVGTAIQFFNHQWWNAPYTAEIKYKWEQTDKIEESNFSEEQYMADLKDAYDCGYSSGYAEAMIDIAEGG